MKTKIFLALAITSVAQINAMQLRSVLPKKTVALLARTPKIQSFVRNVHTEPQKPSKIGWHIPVTGILGCATGVAASEYMLRKGK